MCFDLSLLLPLFSMFNLLFCIIYFPVFLISFPFIFLIFSFLLTVLWSWSPCLFLSPLIFLPTNSLAIFLHALCCDNFSSWRSAFFMNKALQTCFFNYFLISNIQRTVLKLSLNISSLQIGKQKHKEAWSTASKTCVFQVKFICFQLLTVSLPLFCVSGSPTLYVALLCSPYFLSAKKLFPFQPPEIFCYTCTCYKYVIFPHVAEEPENCDKKKVCSKASVTWNNDDWDTLEITRYKYLST